MKKLNIILILAGAILLFHSCVTKYEPDIPLSDKRQLVVEGQITNETGPFRVRLTNTFDIYTNETFGDPVTTAQVQIFDDKGNLYPLYYKTNGWYQTQDTLLQGVPGRTYNLEFTQEDGTQYASTPMLLQNIPPIDSVYYKEVEHTRFENDGTAITENWLNIDLDTKDPLGQTRYWKWDYVETWEVQMLTERLPFLILNPTVTTVYVDIKPTDDTKTTCWVTHPSQTILITSTIDSQVDEISQFPLISIPPNNDRFYIKYSILVKQTALSTEMYKFWQKLKESNEETGSIYDKVPQQVYANIYCCDGKEKVLGYFSASSVKTKRIFIHRFDQPIEARSAYYGCIYGGHFYCGTITRCDEKPELVGSSIGSFSLYCADCRGLGSDKKPDFWE